MLTCLAEETRTCMDQSCKAMKEQQQTISHLVMCGNFPPEHDLLTFRVGFANLQSSASPNIERCRKIRSKLSDLHRREGSLFPDRPIIWTPFEFIINMNCHTLSTPVAAWFPCESRKSRRFVRQLASLMKRVGCGEIWRWTIPDCRSNLAVYPNGQQDI